MNSFTFPIFCPDCFHHLINNSKFWQQKWQQQQQPKMEHPSYVIDKKSWQVCEPLLSSFVQRNVSIQCIWHFVDIHCVNSRAFVRLMSEHKFVPNDDVHAMTTTLARLLLFGTIVWKLWPILRPLYINWPKNMRVFARSMGVCLRVSLCECVCEHVSL